MARGTRSPLATYLFPDDAGNPLEMLQGVHEQWGFVMKSTDINPEKGVFSVRREGDQFDGYVSIDAQADSGPPTTVHVAGPYQSPGP